MPNTYQVWKSNDSLVARIEHVSGKKIDLTYPNSKGEIKGVQQVHRGAESLVAVLLSDSEGRCIEITYINEKGQTQAGRYRNGSEVATARNTDEGVIVTKVFYTKSGQLHYGYRYIDESGHCDPSDLPYIDAYRRLGPELRAKIPQDWHDVLGRWLKNDS